MSQNHLSLRGFNENLLNNKLKSFRQNYSQSLQRNRQRSSLQMLASTVYSKKGNNQLGTQKKRPPSAHNPQIKNDSVAMQGLYKRVQKVPNLSDVNTELLMEKRNLQERILRIKNEIAKQTRQRNRAEQYWKKYSNEKDNSNDAYQQLLKKSNKLNENIADVKAECYQLRNENKELAELNADKMRNINREQIVVEDLENKTRQLKAHLLNEQKQRNFVKGQLLKQQRVMNSASIETKQLENQRAMVLLEINASVLRHML